MVLGACYLLHIFPSTYNPSKSSEHASQLTGLLFVVIRASLSIDSFRRGAFAGLASNGDEGPRLEGDDDLEDDQKSNVLFSPGFKIFPGCQSNEEAAVLDGDPALSMWQNHLPRFEWEKCGVPVGISGRESREDCFHSTRVN